MVYVGWKEARRPVTAGPTERSANGKDLNPGHFPNREGAVPGKDFSDVANVK